ncbi:MAG: hypothetical protein E6J90_00995 [Deltaproteobacteria bacterium]|nr:MAG: hypothetical protein E6J90_00995 [Deltaproteobacteria bacterium]
MSSRVTGAGFALIAVALLAVSIATPAVLPAPLSLFAGHPTVAAHTRTKQEVYVGFFTAELCNSGGDGNCTYGDATAGFRILGYAELGATGLLALSSVALALLTLRKSERRKTVAWAVWTSGALALVGAGAMILYGPFSEASVPIGIGMALHGAGILVAMVAGLFAVRPPPPLRLRVADRSKQPAALPSAQAFDRRAARSDDLFRPGQHGPESRFGPDGRGRPAPAAFDGDADPQSHGPGPAERAGISPTPQLRPLYDAAPTHGGTGGLLPIERPAIPSPPTPPLSREQISAVAGFASSPLATAEPRPPRPLGADDPTLAAPFADPRLPRPRAAPRPTPPPPFAPDHRAAPPGSVEPRSRPSPSTFPVNRQIPPAFPAEPRPPLSSDRPSPSFAEPRPMPPPFAAEPRPSPSSAEPRPSPSSADVPPGQPFSTEQPTTPSAGPDDAAAFHADERPMPPRPVARTKPPSVAPPPNASFAASSGPPPVPSGQAGAKPRTQVSLVPPMPDNDLPIAPPTAQIAAEASFEAPASVSGGESMLFPRAETPLAPPPAPVAPPPRAHRDSQLPPRAHRDSQLPPPRRGAPPTRPPSAESAAQPRTPSDHRDRRAPDPGDPSNPHHSHGPRHPAAPGTHTARERDDRSRGPRRHPR